MTTNQYNFLKYTVYKYATGYPYKDDMIQDLAIKLLKQDETKLTNQYIYVAVINEIKDVRYQSYEDITNINIPEDNYVLDEILGYLTDSERDYVELYLTEGSYRKMAKKVGLSKSMCQIKMQEIIKKLKNYTNEINY